VKLGLIVLLFGFGTWQRWAVFGLSLFASQGLMLWMFRDTRRKIRKNGKPENFRKETSERNRGG
jgi:hypothetical protein